VIQLAAEPSDRRAAGPLVGIRVLALEQMQALPFATQLLARLGADVVKVESPGGELGRASQPSIPDPEGRGLGATFLRNNLGNGASASTSRPTADDSWCSTWHRGST